MSALTQVSGGITSYLNSFVSTAPKTVPEPADLAHGCTEVDEKLVK
jgi:hypothetical protein